MCIRDWGRPAYRKIQITDVTYQTGHVYAFGDVAGSVIGAADVNRLDDTLDTHTTEIAGHETRIDELEYVESEGGPQVGYNFPNGQFERDAAGWNTYANAVQSTPVDGTGGAPAGVTFVRSTSTPLAGLASGLLSKSAVNAQGEGVSYDFTVDLGKRGEPLQIEFLYESAGAYAADDVGAYLYDKTNAVLLPLSIANLPYSTGFQTKFLARAYLNANSGDYRLILHVQSANASAWDLKVDDVKVGGVLAGTGAAIGEWQPYTPALVNGGTVGSVNKCRWRRVGSSMEITASINFASAGAASPFRISMPSGYSADTTRLVPGMAGSTIGVYFWYNASQIPAPSPLMYT